MFILIFFFILSLFTYSTSGNCPSGSVSWNSNCYLFQANATEFATAEIACKRDNGNLVSIHDAFTNALLAGEAPNYFQQSTVNDFWIGGTTMMKPGNWSWMDNSVFDFTDWEKGEPQNVTGLNCVAVSITTGAWSSQDCIKAKPYVCDVTPHSSTTSKPTNPPFVRCPYGWAYFQPTGSCYGTNATDAGHIGKVDWTTAERYCESYGAHLASVHSYDEYNFLNTYDGYSFDGTTWIGLTSQDNGKTWKYSDNTPFDFSQWGSGVNPNVSGCVEIGINGFYPTSCGNQRLFLCEKKAS